MTTVKVDNQITPKPTPTQPTIQTNPTTLPVTTDGTTPAVLDISGQNIPQDGIPLTLTPSDLTNIELDGTNGSSSYTLPASGDLKINVTATSQATGTPTIKITNDKYKTINTSVSLKLAPPAPPKPGPGPGPGPGPNPKLNLPSTVKMHESEVDVGISEGKATLWLEAGTNFPSPTAPLTFTDDSGKTINSVQLDADKGEAMVAIHFKMTSSYTPECIGSNKCYIYFASCDQTNKTYCPSDKIKNLGTVELVNQ